MNPKTVGLSGSDSPVWNKSMLETLNKLLCVTAE